MANARNAGGAQCGEGVVERSAAHGLDEEEYRGLIRVLERTEELRDELMAQRSVTRSLES